MKFKNKIENHKITFLTIFLILIFVYEIFKVDWSGGVLHTGGSATLKSMFTTLLEPDLSKEIIILAIKSCWQTFAYAIISISLAILIAFPLSILSSGIVIKNKIIIMISKGIIGFFRAIHELVWAWMFVAAVGLNPIGAIFALAIPYSGYLGKIFSDILSGVEKNKIEAIKISGGNRIQQIIYGYLPLSFPNMFSYVMYRLECAIRSSSVLSFVGLGGIGFQIQLSLQDRKYNQVWTFMFFLVIMILIIDKWSYGIRRRAK